MTNNTSDGGTLEDEWWKMSEIVFWVLFFVINTLIALFILWFGRHVLGYPFPDELVMQGGTLDERVQAEIEFWGSVGEIEDV